MWARIWFIALTESIAYTYTFLYYKQWDIVRASQGWDGNFGIFYDWGNVIYPSQPSGPSVEGMIE